VVRSGSYPVSRIVPKKPSRMPHPGGLVRTPTEPHNALRKDLVRLVPKCVLHTSRVASPAQDKPVRGGLNQGPRRSGPVHGALSPALVYLVGLFDLDPLLPLPSPAAPAPGPLSPRGFWRARREALDLQRRVRALACLKSTVIRTDNDNTTYAEPLYVGLNYLSYTYCSTQAGNLRKSWIRWIARHGPRSSGSPDAAKKGPFWQGLLLL
jgi:hypothetical protein